jgi:hypothetical protein
MEMTDKIIHLQLQLKYFPKEAFGKSGLFLIHLVIAYEEEKCFFRSIFQFTFSQH